MHPAAALLITLAFMTTLQWLAWPLLPVIGGALLLTGKPVMGRWWNLLRRSRWLLLTLWLILSYGTPGDAWLGLAWAPTEAGLDDASWHVVRLALMLGVLSWLLAYLSREQLMCGLWFLLSPLMRFGVDVRAAVVRVFLVLLHVEAAPPAGTWRHLLDESAMPAGGESVVSLALPRWQSRDTVLLFGVLVFLSLGVGFS